MSSIFVERNFDLAPSGTVTLKVFAPVRQASDWRCVYVITWPDRERSFYASGIDGVQALILALERAAFDLAASPEMQQGSLTFLGGTDLMLKTFPNASDG